MLGWVESEVSPLRSRFVGGLQTLLCCGLAILICPPSLKLFTLCAFARGKVIGLSIVVVVGMKIARYRHLSELYVSTTRLSNVAKTVCFKSMTWTSIATSITFCVDHTHQPHAPTVDHVLPAYATTTTQVSR